MVYKQVFPDAVDTLDDRNHRLEKRQDCLTRQVNRLLLRNVEPKFIWNGTICKSKPQDNWTADVYVDFMVLSGEGVPRQTVHVQGDTLRDLLNDKKKHCRQLQLQTKCLRKVLDKQMTANAEEINKAGVDIERGPWPLEAPEAIPKELSGIFQLFTVLELHQQRCRICEDDTQALDALLKQVKGAGRVVPCIRKVFITPSWYEKGRANLQRWLPEASNSLRAEPNTH
ncbi:g8929 [Coccomyxa elongata]